MEEEINIELPEITVGSNKKSGLLGDMDVKVDIDEKKINSIVSKVGITIAACALLIFTLIMLNNILKKKL